MDDAVDEGDYATGIKISDKELSYSTQTVNDIIFCHGLHGFSRIICIGNRTFFDPTDSFDILLGIRVLSVSSVAK